MRIDIYLDTDARNMHPEIHGHSWYIMESTFKGKPLIKSKSITWMEHNRNGALLEGLLFALTQIKVAEAEVHVFSDSRYIVGRCTEKQLREWDMNGYMTKEGEYIKYRNLWCQIGTQIISLGIHLYTHRELEPEKKQELTKIGEALKRA